MTIFNTFPERILKYGMKKKGAIEDSLITGNMDMNYSS
jgi:hypothetical protein